MHNAACNYCMLMDVACLHYTYVDGFLQVRDRFSAHGLSVTKSLRGRMSYLDTRERTPERRSSPVLFVPGDS